MIQAAHAPCDDETWAAARKAITAEMEQLKSLKRASPHVYNVIRATGVRSVKKWLEIFAAPELRHGPRSG